MNANAQIGLINPKYPHNMGSIVLYDRQQKKSKIIWKKT